MSATGVGALLLIGSLVFAIASVLLKSRRLRVVAASTFVVFLVYVVFLVGVVSRM